MVRIISLYATLIPESHSALAVATVILAALPARRGEAEMMMRARGGAEAAAEGTTAELDGRDKEIAELQLTWAPLEDTDADHSLGPSGFRATAECPVLWRSTNE